MNRLVMLLLLGSLQTANGQESANDDIHEQLRILRERMLAAYEKRDVDALLMDVAPDAVITWQNGDRHMSHAEFTKFYREMVGDNGYVKQMTSKFDVGGTSIVYGDDTAIAYGTCADHFTLADGSDFELDSKWTATVVKQDSGWKVASFHMSTSIFDNPILNSAKGWLVKIAVISGLIGILIGFVVKGLMGKKPTVAA